MPARGNEVMTAIPPPRSKVVHDVTVFYDENKDRWTYKCSCGAPGYPYFTKEDATMCARFHERHPDGCI